MGHVDHLAPEGEGHDALGLILLEQGQQLSGVGHLVGGLLGGMLKVGTAVASEIAKDQAKRAELRRADEAARVAGRPVLVELPDADADASA